MHLYPSIQLQRCLRYHHGQCLLWSITSLAGCVHELLANAVWGGKLRLRALGLAALHSTHASSCNVMHPAILRQLQF